MKKLAFLFFALCLSALATAQINQPADSIPTLLCKKWVVSYALMDGKRIELSPRAPATIFDFKRDNTVLLWARDYDPKIKGIWTYDTVHKVVKVTVNGRSRATIHQLQADQLVLTNEGAPAKIRMVYIVKNG